MERLDLQQILKETSESVTNGHTIKKLEEFRELLKESDKKSKQSLKYAIKILEEVIKLKKQKKKTFFNVIYISALLVTLIFLMGNVNAMETPLGDYGYAQLWNMSDGNIYVGGLEAREITVLENFNFSSDLNVAGKSNFTENVTFGQDVNILGTLYGGSPVKIGGGINITTGHLFISAGDLHIDGNLVHDQGDVSFSGGSFDVAGEITATGFVSTIFESASGNLKLQAGAVGDVVLFSSADIDNADDGKELKIWRNAVEGNNYIKTYITSTQNALLHSNTNILLQNANGKNIQFNSGQHIYLNLGDSAGSDEVRIRDNGGLEIMTIDSNGNIWSRGDVSIGVDSDVLIQANGDSYFNGGFVGFGGLVANSRLSIVGNESGDHSNDAGIAMQNTATDGDTWYLRVGANGTTTPKGGFSIADTTAYRFVIDENGNIGIGTIAPGLPLEVRSADDNQALFFDSSAQAQGVGGGIAFGGKYSDAGGEAMAGRIGTQKTNGVSGDISWDMVFETQDFEGSITERMILTGDGKVGIGVENPTKALEVGGDVYIDGELETQNGIIIGSNIQVGGTVDGIDIANDLALLDSPDFTGDVTFDSYTLFVDSTDNRVGIGTSDPKEELHINSTHPTITFEESDGSSNEKVWEVGASGDEFLIRTANDLHTGTQVALRFGDRAGTGIGLIEFPQGDVVIGDLSGSGNDYACLDSTGKLFRSNTAC